MHQWRSLFLVPFPGLVPKSELLQRIFEGFVEIFGTPIFQKSSEWLLPCNNELRYLGIKWKSGDKICGILFWYFLLLWQNMTMARTWLWWKWSENSDDNFIGTRYFLWRNSFFFFSKATGLQLTTLLIMNYFFHKCVLRFLTRHG